MQIFMISLPGAVARRTALLGQLNQLGFACEVVDGVIVKTDEIDTTGYNDKRRIAEYGYSMSNGEIGCFLAHRRAWKKVCEGPDKCLILEDDALLTSLSPGLLDDVARSPFRLVRLAGIFAKKFRFVARSHYAKYWGDPSGATAYVLGREAAARLLRKSERFHMAVDDFLEARYLHGIHAYAVLPYPVTTSGAVSQIEDRMRRPMRTSQRLIRMVVRIPLDVRKYVHRLAYYYIRRT